MKIWVHTLVKNEERYIWFAVMSVIDHVDRMLIWDTGSTDATVQIIKEIQQIYSQKVNFREVGDVDINKFTEIRQQMLEETKSDWFMILDGDEVWWDDAITEATAFIRKQGNDYESVVNRYYNIVGDIYHHQEEAAGRYKIDDERGHLNIRFANRNIPGLHFEKPHGQLGLYDGKGILIQNRSKEKREHLRVGYMHFTNVIRSETRPKDLLVPKRDLKLKYDLGRGLPYDFYYPEVFFKSRPSIVPSTWVGRSREYRRKALLQWPVKFLKRRIFKYGKTGY